MPQPSAQCGVGGGEAEKMQGNADMRGEKRQKNEHGTYKNEFTHKDTQKNTYKIFSYRN